MPEALQYRYIRDSLYESVHALATGLDSLEERLEHEFRSIRKLRTGDFPEEFQKKFEEIMEALIVEEARHDEGRAISTLKGISNQTAQEIAGKIVELYQGVEDKYSADQLSQLTRD